MSNNEKLVSVSYIETILTKLYDWMPFKRKNGGIQQDSRDEDGNITTQITNSDEIALGRYNLTDSNTILSIGIGDVSERKNAIKITKNGEVFIVTNLINGSAESLQHTLDRKGVNICNDYNEMIPYISEDYLGKCLYLTKDSVYENETYKEGLYIVSINTKGSKKIKLFKIGDSIQTDLSNYYTKSEIDEIVKNIVAGDLTDVYYTKSEIDDMLSNVSDRLEVIEEFVDTPIMTSDLENIIKKDLNNDGNIG